MRKMILVGRSECGKTTLRQALKGGKIQYEKTQYINHFDVIIDTPGEYAETTSLAHALAIYAYESDVVALVISATEPYSLYPPHLAPQANRPVIGIVTKADHPNADVEQAVRWLELTKASPIFVTSSFTGDGIWAILNYLKEEGDVLPWETQEEAEEEREIISTKFEVSDFGNKDFVWF